MSSIGTLSVSTGSFIPEIVDQHRENSSSLWLQRAYAVAKTSHQLNDLVALDERIEANIDGLRVALRSGWRISHADLQKGEAADFFCTGVLALESGPSGSIEELIDLAQRTATETVGMPYHCAYDPWRGLVSAFAWIDRAHVPGMIDRLTSSSDPCRHWLGVATCGVRRILDHPSLAAALGDTERLVRTRAARAVGELGRTDLLKDLSVLRLTRDPECRFWSAWAAARMGATEPLDTLADIAWNNLPRADRALDLLLRRLEVPQANAWLREFAKLPDRQRSLIRATGVIGDPLYIPWLIERMAEPATARLAGEAFSMITGLDLAYRDLDRRPPADFQSGPNDDPADENVALDEDENLPWPNPERIGQWWTANRSRFSVGTPYFLGAPKATADWLEALSDAFQRQRHAAALELAIRQPDKAMFEVRARGRLQRQLLARARGSA